MLCLRPAADAPETAGALAGVDFDAAALCHNARNHALFGRWVTDEWVPYVRFPLYTLFQSMAFRLLGVGLVQMRLLPALLSILALLLVGLIVTRATGRNAGALAVLAAAVTFGMLVIARAGRPEPLAWFFILLSAWSLGKGYERTSRADGRTWRGAAGMAGAGMAGACAVLCQPAAWPYLAALVLVVLIHPPERRATTGWLILALALPLLVWAGPILRFSPAVFRGAQTHSAIPAAEGVWYVRWLNQPLFTVFPRARIVLITACLALVWALPASRHARNRPQFIAVTVLAWSFLFTSQVLALSTHRSPYTCALLLPHAAVLAVTACAALHERLRKTAVAWKVLLAALLIALLALHIYPNADAWWEGVYHPCYSARDLGRRLGARYRDIGIAGADPFLAVMENRHRVIKVTPDGLNWKEMRRDRVTHVLSRDSRLDRFYRKRFGKLARKSTLLEVLNVEGRDWNLHALHLDSLDIAAESDAGAEGKAAERILRMTFRNEDAHSPQDATVIIMARRGEEIRSLDAFEVDVLPGQSVVHEQAFPGGDIDSVFCFAMDRDIWRDTETDKGFTWVKTRPLEDARAWGLWARGFRRPGRLRARKVYEGHIACKVYVSAGVQLAAVRLRGELLPDDQLELQWIKADRVFERRVITPEDIATDHYRPVAIVVRDPPMDEAELRVAFKGSGLVCVDALSLLAGDYLADMAFWGAAFERTTDASWVARNVLDGESIVLKEVCAPEVKDPDLPRVLLIGDSISIHYTKAARWALAGRANVYHVCVNAGSTGAAVEEIDEWLKRVEWDVIHFNWGLHDLKYSKHGQLTFRGRQRTPLQEYEKNLHVLVKRLKQTGARLIWASTTPIPEGCRGRRHGDEVRYNHVAARVMKRHRVPINDLHAVVLPALETLQFPRNVHFHAEGYEVLGRAVAEAVKRELPRDGRRRRR
ncbi:MAG: SGNH/GDSL hydrolase family protein [Kiritimatiellae bacterium]|nr:SGNH/GDSL hydrolase family protein [Kiritimatiellia bacterium]